MKKILFVFIIAGCTAQTPGTPKAAEAGRGALEVQQDTSGLPPRAEVKQGSGVCRDPDGSARRYEIQDNQSVSIS